MATKEELEEQLAQTRADMKILASLAAERGQTVAAGVREDVTARAEQLSDDAQQMVDNALKEGRRLAGAAENQMKANPLASVGIAFGVGYVVGSLLRR